MQLIDPVQTLYILSRYSYFHSYRVIQKEKIDSKHKNIASIDPGTMSPGASWTKVKLPKYTRFLPRTTFLITLVGFRKILRFGRTYIRASIIGQPLKIPLCDKTVGEGLKQIY